MKNLLLIATGSVAIEKFKKVFLLLNGKYNVKVVISKYVKDNFDFWNDIHTEDENLKLNTYPTHIKLAKWADLIVVIPATANTIAKFNAGIADNFVATILLAARQKILFIPAMNTYMFNSLIERGIISDLSNLGHMFLGPYVGMLREEEIGMGRMAEPEDIFNTINNILTQNKKTILITLGASKVYIDPLRYITNGATGTFGNLIATELRLFGHKTIILDISNMSNIEVLERIKNTYFDIYISNAAFADFDIKDFSKTKIKKGLINSIELKSNVDVLIEATKLKKDIYAFKLDNKKDNAIKKMQDLKLKGIIWNKIPATGNNLITGSLILKNKEIKFDSILKNKAAKIIAEVINNG